MYVANVMLVLGSVILLIAMDATGAASADDASLEQQAAAFVSRDRRCGIAAESARAAAIAAGIAPARLEWLYVRKPFEREGHVVLLIDGRVVVDNGGLGRNLWGDAICPGLVCTVDEVRRAVDTHVTESADLAVRAAFTPQEWSRLAVDHAARD